MRLIRRQLAAFSVYTVPTHLARFLRHHTLCMRYRMDKSRRWSTKYGQFTCENICGAFKNSVKVTVYTYQSAPVCSSKWTPNIQSLDKYRSQLVLRWQQVNICQAKKPVDVLWWWLKKELQEQASKFFGHLWGPCCVGPYF